MLCTFPLWLFIPDSPLTRSYVHSSMTFREQKIWMEHSFALPWGEGDLSHTFQSLYLSREGFSQRAACWVFFQLHKRVYTKFTPERCSVQAKSTESQWPPGPAENNQHYHQHTKTDTGHVHFILLFCGVVFRSLTNHRQKKGISKSSLSVEHIS